MRGNKLVFLFSMICFFSAGGCTLLNTANNTIHTASTTPANQSVPAKMVGTYGKLPMTFAANQGQANSLIRFLSQGRGYALFLTSNETVLTLHRSHDKPSVGIQPFTGMHEKTVKAEQQKLDSLHAEFRAVLHMRLDGASSSPKVTGLDELPGKNNYFIGNNSDNWLTDVSTYARVLYEEIYPGIDLVFYGNQRELEFDFAVAPGANPEAIRMSFMGADQLSLDEQNNLVIIIQGEAVKLKAPKIYQNSEGKKQVVAGNYVLLNKDVVSFRMAGYDKNRKLIIDPTLEYSSFLGGMGTASTDLDEAFGIAVDASGYTYITGTTQSTDFPVTTGAYNVLYPGGTIHAFISKINPSGTQIVYSTFLGGSNYDVGFSIDVDTSGNAYVTGKTLSTDFPITQGVIQNTFGGGFSISPPISGTFDAFVTKVNSSGNALDYSTYLGGSDDDEGSGIVVDSSGTAYVTGSSKSTNMPASGQSVQANNAGETDAFVSMLDPFAQSIVWATYLGGSGHDWGYAIDIDSSSNVYITGQTRSTDFPTTSGAFGMVGNVVGTNDSDAFVSKIDLGGTPPNIGTPTLSYSTYLGGTSTENQSFRAGGIAVDSSANIYVTGNTMSDDFPTTPSAYQGTRKGGSDAFMTKINPSDTTGNDLVNSTYLGGTSGDQGMDIVVDSSGQAYVTGNTFSSDFPQKNAMQASYGGTDTTFAGDAFVVQFNSNGTELGYSTFLGGSGGDKSNGIDMDDTGNIYVTGETRPLSNTTTNNFPTTSGAFQGTFAGGLSDVFVAKVSTTFSINKIDIKVNGSDGPVNITQKDTLSITVAVDPGGYTSADADWWIAVNTSYMGWFYYDLSLGWMPGLNVTYQGPLLNLSSYKVVDLSDDLRLPAGSYTFYFAVDLKKNGTLDTGTGQVFFDSVTVTVK